MAGVKRGRGRGNLDQEERKGSAPPSPLARGLAPFFPSPATLEFITEVHVGVVLGEVYILKLRGSFTLEWRWSFISPKLSVSK